MSSFFYAGTDAQGVPRQGVLDEASLESARRLLEKHGLMITTLQPQEQMPWTTVNPPSATTDKTSASSAQEEYIPVSDTLRLFAGWLLAWYGVVYLLGFLQMSGRIPESVPFIQALFVSPTILRLAFGTYLFLLLSTLHRTLGRGALLGVLGALLWLLLMYAFHVNA